MAFSFLPTMVTDAVTDINPNMLRQRGIRLLMLDFDNTLVPYTTSVPTAEVNNWLKAMQQDGLELCVVSNSRRPRVKVFCEQYGLNCITHAKKPFAKGIRQCLQQYGYAPKECALAGDQIYTDTLGANCQGVNSILVKAIHNHNIWLKLRHVAELPWIAMASKRRIQK